MTQIKLRRDTAANFASKNPVLGVGEPAYETDTKKLKIGDGTTAYNSLDYFAGGGGSTEFTVVQPLKLVDSTLTLQIDEQTIQVQDGKLVANLDELGNEVNTLAGDVTGIQADLTNKQDKLTAGDNITISTDNIISATGEGLKVKRASSANFNSAELLETGLYFISGGYTPQNGPVPYSVAGMLITMKSYAADNNQNIQQTWIGCEDLVGNQIYTRYSNSDGAMNTWARVDSNKIASASALGSIKIGDNLSITEDGTLSATGGPTPTNMVTTDTLQTITGGKTFEDKIIFNSPDSDTAEQSSILGGAFKLGTPNNDNSIHASNLTLNATTTNTGTFKVQTTSSQFTQINGATITSQKTHTGAVSIVSTVRPSGADRNKKYSALYSEVDANYNHKLTINNLSSDLVLAGKTVKDGSGNTFLTSGDVAAYVTEEFINGTEGYRLWSNGRGEQWGSFTGPKPITFLKNYADTNYTLLISVVAKTSGEPYNGVFGIEKTTTGFDAGGLAGTTGDAYIISTTGTCNWYTSGTLAT